MPSGSGKAGRFQPGDDPRRNKAGARNKEAQSFAARFANALAAGGKPEDLTAVLWERAKRGQEWAISIILDRLIGKPKENEGQPAKLVFLYADEAEALLGRKEGKP